MRRSVWFAAGAGVGVLAVARARRIAESLTPEGLTDRLSALSVGLRLFGDEVRAGASERETELRGRLGLTPDEDTTPQLPPGPVTPAARPEPLPQTNKTTEVDH